MKYSCLKETQKAMKMSFPLVGNHSPQRCWTSQHDKEEYFQVNIRHKVSKEIQKLMFLIFFLVFHFSLFTFHFSLSYAENLSDIKLNALDKPIEEKWGRDPFIRYGDKIAKLKGKTFREDMPVGLKITGIISDGKKAVAIINGGFYRKNERVNNFLIVDIAKDRVSLEKNGKRVYLGVEKFAMETRRDNAMDGDKGKDKKEDKEAKE